MNILVKQQHMAGAALRLKIVKPILFPSQALSRSGSKGMISAVEVFGFKFYVLRRILNIQPETWNCLRHP
jgi:hypothetical protein